MGADCFKELKRHLGHEIVCVGYGKPIINVSIECEDCNEVLFDYDTGENKPIKRKPVYRVWAIKHQIVNETRVFSFNDAKALKEKWQHEYDEVCFDKEE